VQDGLTQEKHELKTEKASFQFKIKKTDQNAIIQSTAIRRLEVNEAKK
jgi:hypothetical protein